MAQRLIQGDQLDLTSIPTDGSGLTNVDADFLNGDNAAFYRNAGNLNAGVLLNARVQQSNVTQYEGALSIGGGQVTSAVANATLAANSTLLGGQPVGVGAFDIVALDGSSRLPAVDGSQLTNLPSSGATLSPQLAYNGFLSTTIWNHGLGVVPKIVQIFLINVGGVSGGYANGSILSLNHTLSESDSGGGPQNDGVAVQITATQVIVRIANRNAFSLTTGNGHFNIGAAGWNMLIGVIG